jgi:O-antigen/teichoic acid export membrane protein
VPILFSPILTRVFTPYEFGGAQYIISITSIAVVVSTGSYEKAIILPSNENRARGLLIGSILVCIVFSLALLICIWVLNGNAETIGYGGEFWHLYFIPMYVFVIGISNSLDFKNLRMGYFRSMAVANSSKSIFNTSISLGTGYLGFGLVGLLIGKLAGESIRLLVLLWKSWRDIVRLSIKGLVKNIRSTLVEYRQFPMYSAPNGLVNALSTQLVIILLTMHFSEILVGHYSLTVRVMFLPIVLVASSLGQVFYKYAVKEYEKDDESLYRFFTSVLKWLVISAIIPSLVIVIWGPQIFKSIFGADWEVSGQIARWLIAWFFFFYVKSPLSSIVNIKKKLKDNLQIQVFLLFARIVALYVGVYLEDVLLAILLFGVIGALFNFLHLVWFWTLVRIKNR